VLWAKEEPQWLISAEVASASLWTVMPGIITYVLKAMTAKEYRDEKEGWCLGGKNIKHLIFSYISKKMLCNAFGPIFMLGTS